jgi:hypothetical protein
MRCEKLEQLTRPTPSNEAYQLHHARNPFIGEIEQRERLQERFQARTKDSIELSHLDQKVFVGNTRNMVAIVDERRRLTMPKELPAKSQVLVEAAGEGRWVITEIKPTVGRKMSREEVLQAIEASTWQPTTPWDEIRKDTREQ